MDNKENIICIDVVSIPPYLDMDKVVYGLQELNIILYDSSMGGNKPYVLNEADTFNKVLVDVSTEEGKMICDKLIGMYDEAKE